MYNRANYPDFWTIEDIKRANADAGYHFFSPDTMRFFNSRVSDDVYQGPGGVFFVTSEKNKGMYNDYPRLYTVRQFLPETGDVKNMEGFQKYKTLDSAKRAAKRYANSGLVVA